jgi:hypothetical protein
MSFQGENLTPFEKVLWHSGYAESLHLLAKFAKRARLPMFQTSSKRDNLNHVFRSIFEQRFPNAFLSALIVFGASGSAMATGGTQSNPPGGQTSTIIPFGPKQTGSPGSSDQASASKSSGQNKSPSAVTGQVLTKAQASSVARTQNSKRSTSAARNMTSRFAQGSQLKRFQTTGALSSEQKEALVSATDKGGSSVKSNLPLGTGGDVGGWWTVGHENTPVGATVLELEGSGKSASSAVTSGGSGWWDLPATALEGPGRALSPSAAGSGIGNTGIAARRARRAAAAAANLGLVGSAGATVGTSGLQQWMSVDLSSEGVKKKKLKKKKRSDAEAALKKLLNPDYGQRSDSGIVGTMKRRRRKQSQYDQQNPGSSSSSSKSRSSQSSGGNSQN